MLMTEKTTTLLTSLISREMLGLSVEILFEIFIQSRIIYFIKPNF